LLRPEKLMMQMWRNITAIYNPDKNMLMLHRAPGFVIQRVVIDCRTKHFNLNMR